MEIKFEVADDKISNFTDSAKCRLLEQSQRYTLEVISEAEKVEKLIRENGASAEITDNIIFIAIRRSKTGKRKNIKITVLRIIAEIFLFISGLLFMPEMFITSENTFNLVYFSIFALITVIALVTTIITYFLGGE